MVPNRATHQICPSESVTRRTVRFSSLVTANTILRYLRASINFTETPLFCSCSMLLISMLENLNFVLFDRSNNSGAINVKMYGSVLKEKSTFKVLALAFSSNWIGALTLFLLLRMNAFKKVGALIHSMKFLSVRVLFISINLSHSLAWNTVAMSGLMLRAATWIC